jgi:hypothetical protein
VPPQFAQRLKTRLTLRPDMTGRPNSFLIYDYLAWHRATPNYSRGERLCDRPARFTAVSASECMSHTRLLTMVTRDTITFIDGASVMPGWPQPHAPGAVRAHGAEGIQVSMRTPPAPATRYA